MGLIEQTTERRDVQPRWRRDVRRTMNLKVHQHRSPAALFTLYFCECDSVKCDLKVALTDDEFAGAAGGARGYVTHPRCAGASGRRRGLFRRRTA